MLQVAFELDHLLLYFILFYPFWIFLDWQFGQAFAVHPVAPMEYGGDIESAMLAPDVSALIFG